jgi:pSer/pThr/pTyr-binding forkhead associated (FHA) protein/ribosomal protein L40E
MIVCPNCNHQNPEGASQCEACYAPLPITIGCPNCGASVQSDATFCGQCGFNLQAEIGQNFGMSSGFASSKQEQKAVPTSELVDAEIPPTTPSMSVPSPWDEDIAPLPHQSIASREPVETEYNGFEDRPDVPTQPGKNYFDSRSEPYEESIPARNSQPQPDLYDESTPVRNSQPQPDLYDEPTSARNSQPQPDLYDELYGTPNTPSYTEPDSEFDGEPTFASYGDRDSEPYPEPPVAPYDRPLDSYSENAEDSPYPELDDPDIDIVADSYAIATPVVESEPKREESVYTPPPIPSSKPAAASLSNSATQLQTQKVSLYHVQTNTNVDIAQHLSIIHLGKPNSQIPPDVDVSGFPNSEIVSRIHADIRVEGDAYFIEDMGSSNGTYINHTPLLPGNRHRLRNGDRIALGKGDKVTFIFQVS